MLVFSTQLCEMFPSLPLPCVINYTTYTVREQCVRGDGILVWGSDGDRILQEMNTLYLTRFITYKIAAPPQTKIKGG
jgi:hypothetical protein